MIFLLLLGSMIIFRGVDSWRMLETSPLNHSFLRQMPGEAGIFLAWGGSVLRVKMDCAKRLRCRVQINQTCSLPKTNSEFTPENGWLEDEISYWEGVFSGDMLVSGRVCSFNRVKVVKSTKYCPCPLTLISEGFHTQFGFCRFLTFVGTKHHIIVFP